MTLDKLKLNEEAIISSINCDDILRNRLYSFGIIKGSILKVVAFTLTKSTIEIKVNQTKVALRLVKLVK
ncbi:MAG: FeoA domain-containing protein [Aliarcobacter sp.]